MKLRDKFVIGWFFVLFAISWALSLANLFGIHFWDKKYALAKIREQPTFEEEGGGNIGQGFQEIGESYYTNRRYIWFLPHVIGAVLWWNLYFLQLIPKIRHWKQKSFHRVLGRFLLVVLLVQTISGVGLAATSHSNIIKLVSYVLAIATIFCICQAWRYAYFRDIPKHKHWVIRLVGYMQTISLQRFWLLVLIISHAFGWEGLYPQLDDDDATEEEWKELTKKMFDDSFVICILHAILSTEWYLATEQGMLDTPTNNRRTPIQKPEEGSDDDKNLNSSAESLESRGMNDDELVEEEEEHGNVQPSTMDDENSMKET